MWVRLLGSAWIITRPIRVSSVCRSIPGDVRAAVVLTRPQLEQLRSCVTDSLARDDAVRRRRGGEDAAAICDGLRRR